MFVDPKPTKPYLVKFIGKAGTYFSVTPSVTPTMTPTPLTSLSPTPTKTVTPTPTKTVTPTPTKTVTPTNTQTITPTPTPTTPPLPFISVWRTTAPNENITLPYSPTGTYSGIIDWGDGNTDINDGSVSAHTYTSPGDYTVTITGTITGFRFNNTGDKTKIREILQWGPVRGMSNQNTSMFRGCSNLVLTGVTDIPNLVGILSLQTMFQGCSSLTTVNNMNSWNVSDVTIMAAMFLDSTNFNQNIGGWNVSSVQNMSSMFQGATSFNNGANPSISGWNVSNVMSMFGMFQNSAFNQDIGSWDVSNVTNMIYMFLNATAFNQDLSGWCVTSIPTLPTDFDTGASSWVLPRPVWGTCPP